MESCFSGRLVGLRVPWASLPTVLGNSLGLVTYLSVSITLSIDRMVGLKLNLL